MKPIGGTEILVNAFNKFTKIKEYPELNIIPSLCDINLLVPGKKNIIWQHNMPDQPVVSGMFNKLFIDAVDHFVFVSQYQLDEYKKLFDLDPDKVSVIENAIEPIEFVEKPSTDKIRLIYTSAPFRGLDVLIEAFKSLNRDDVELHVYSSNIIYGTEHSRMIGDRYESLFHACRKTDGIVYKGFAPNHRIREALKESHIFAYPSTFKETSCLAAIEAGASGCKIVTTNLGALPDTCGDFATYVDYEMEQIESIQDYENRKKLLIDFAQALNTEIDKYKELNYNGPIQSKSFNERFSWVNRSTEWNEFFERMSK